MSALIEIVMTHKKKIFNSKIVGTQTGALKYHPSNYEVTYKESLSPYFCLNTVKTFYVHSQHFCVDIYIYHNTLMWYAVERQRD